MTSSTAKPALPGSVAGYFEAVSTLDRGAYLACFSQDAVVRDPYGGRPLQGRDGFNKFMDGMERTWAEFKMTPEKAFAAADRVAVSWATEATAKSGKKAEFAGVNVFTLNEDGLISQLDGYWDFKAMAAQIT